VVRISDFGFRIFLRFALGLAKAGDPISFFPLTALLEQFDPFEAFHDIPFSAQSGSGAKTTML
jgi:hypothetical protein